MAHGIVGRRFQRFSTWRKATVRDIAKAAIIHQRIRTTGPRAKEARKLVDRLISIGKEGSLAARRRAFAILGDHRLVKVLFDKIAPRFKSRAGGYTRIIPLGLRRGDNAQMVFLELSEREVLEKRKKKAPAKVKETKPAGEKAETGDASVIEKKPVAPEAKPEKKPLPDKGKQSGKGVVGGFRKMFQRKTGAE